MQIKDVLTEQAPVPAAGVAGTAQTTPAGAVPGAVAAKPGAPAAQPVTPQSLSKALMPLGVNLKSTSTPTLHQYFTKVGAKTTELKKTGDPYADTILAMFGFQLR